MSDHYAPITDPVHALLRAAAHVWLADGGDDDATLFGEFARIAAIALREEKQGAL